MPPGGHHSSASAPQHVKRVSLPTPGAFSLSGLAPRFAHGIPPALLAPSASSRPLHKKPCLACSGQADGPRPKERRRPQAGALPGTAPAKPLPQTRDAYPRTFARLPPAAHRRAWRGFFTISTPTLWGKPQAHGLAVWFRAGSPAPQPSKFPKSPGGKMYGFCAHLPITTKQ